MIGQFFANLAYIEFRDNQIKVFQCYTYCTYRRTDGQIYVNIHGGECENSYNVKQLNSFEKMSNIIQI